MQATHTRAARAGRLLGALASHSLFIAAIIVVFAGVTLLLWALTPACDFEGTVEGTVAPLWYNIMLYGKPLRLSVLEAIRLIALVPTYLSLFMILSFIVSIALIPRRAGAELLLGVSLGYLSLGIISPLLDRVIRAVCKSLDLDLVYTTSAGVVNLGTTTVEYSHFHAMLASMKLYLVFALSLVVLSTLAYLHEAGLLSERKREV